MKAGAARKINLDEDCFESGMMTRQKKFVRIKIMIKWSMPANDECRRKRKNLRDSHEFRTPKFRLLSTLNKHIKHLQ